MGGCAPASSSFFLLFLLFLLFLPPLPLCVSSALLATSYFFLLFLLFLPPLPDVLPDVSPDVSLDCDAEDCDVDGAGDVARSSSPDLSAMLARDRRARMSALSGNFCAATVNRLTASRKRPVLT